jgi:hypothetical protein
MSHDDYVKCRCEVRALEAKLAALKPLVRAAVEWGFVHKGGGTGVIVHQIDALTSACLNLTPALREWAMGDKAPPAKPAPFICDFTERPGCRYPFGCLCRDGKPLKEDDK